MLGNTPIHRRTLAKGVAWTTPAIVLTVAAPAFAASPCPAARIVGSFASATADRITITNLGPGVIPAGSTITWQIQNVLASSATLSLTSVAGVSLTSGTTPIVLAAGASTTWTFTIGAAVAVNGTVNWTFGITNFTYNSRVTVNITDCASSSACVSDRFNVLGTTCPTAPAGRTSLIPIPKGQVRVG